MSERRIGFVGLGQMGTPVASRLLQAGVPVRLIDQSAARVEELTEAFPGLATGAVDLEELDVVIIMLPNSRIVEAVVRSALERGELREGAVIVDMGSSEPLSTRKLAQEAKARGIGYVDAPVSGGVVRAKAGTLAIMTGGEPDQVESVAELLAHFGPEPIYVGPSGAGHAAKALNNLVSAATLSVTSEALLAARDFGIDESVMNSVLNRSSGRSNTSETKVEQFILSGSFASGFALQLMAKDLQIAEALLSGADGLPSVASAAIEAWKRAAERSTSVIDHTAMYSLIEETKEGAR